MTRKCVTDEQYGNLNRRLDEVKRRVDEGTLPYDQTMSALQAFIEQRFGGRSLTVNYTLSLADMIAMGHYDWVSDNITAKHFPNLGSGKAEIVAELVQFDRTISTIKVIAELARRGFRPATLAELLAYGAKFPEDQHKFPIVALGTEAVVNGERLVAYLDRSDAGRVLDLGWMDVVWHGRDRFLAVRNQAL